MRRRSFDASRSHGVKGASQQRRTVASPLGLWVGVALWGLFLSSCASARPDHTGRRLPAASDPEGTPDAVASGATRAQRDPPIRGIKAGEAPPTDTPSADTSSTPAAPVAGNAAATISRRELMAVLSRGLPTFLASVSVSPSLRNGRFHGWTIVAMKRPPLGFGTGLAPGDVVIQVNGKPIERPEEALGVWRSLAVAPELLIVYERRGERRFLVYPIVP